MSDDEFAAALAYAQHGPKLNLSNAQKLEMYGLFKQSTCGRNTTKKPGFTKPVEKMKWDAWNKLGTLSKDDAKKKYVKLVDKLAPTWREHKRAKL